MNLISLDLFKFLNEIIYKLFNWVWRIFRETGAWARNFLGGGSIFLTALMIFLSRNLKGL